MEKLDEVKDDGKSADRKSGVSSSGGNASGLSRKVDTHGMDGQEKQERAEREKEKGNEVKIPLKFKC